MSDALTDGERMTREHLARTAGMKWCSKHCASYTVECPTCADLRRIYDKAIAEHDAQVAKRKDSDYRRGLIDGLREAAQTVCKTFCTPELPIAWSEDYAAFVHIGALRSDMRCVANRVYKRIAELEAQRV